MLRLLVIESKGCEEEGRSYGKHPMGQQEAGRQPIYCKTLAPPLINIGSAFYKHWLLFPKTLAPPLYIGSSFYRHWLLLL